MMVEALRFRFQAFLKSNHLLVLTKKTIRLGSVWI
jgi:hypothetical protein